MKQTRRSTRSPTQLDITLNMMSKIQPKKEPKKKCKDTQGLIFGGGSAYYQGKIKSAILGNNEINRMLNFIIRMKITL